MRTVEPHPGGMLTTDVEPGGPTVRRKILQDDPGVGLHDDRGPVRGRTEPRPYEPPYDRPHEPLYDRPHERRYDRPYERSGPQRRPPSGRSRHRRRRSHSGRRRAVGWVLVLVVFGLAGATAWNALSVWRTWRSVERESFDMVAFEALPEVSGDASADAASVPQLAVEAVTPADDVAAGGAYDRYDTYMVVGSDEGNLRADVIILGLLPEDGSAPIMVSLPRDLYLPNRCTQGFSRINANFNGCGDIGGGTALAGAVQDFTGLTVDHFALFTFDGFASIIDSLGGMELCLDHPVRELPRFELPAGCNVASGEVTLEWIRSRKTQEYVDGQWQRVSNVSDLTRNERQQELLISVFERAAAFESPQQMMAVVASVGNTFTLDDRMSLGQAVDVAWSNRGLDTESIIRLKLPVDNHVTPGGAQVLVPSKPFNEVLTEGVAAAEAERAAGN